MADKDPNSLKFPPKFLNPQNDIIFKIFFAAVKKKPLLISFLENTLELAEPIEDVEFLNPTLPKENLTDKGIVLDIAVKLKNQAQIDVEMQIASDSGFLKRILYYWARLHHSQLLRGHNYPKLVPTISIAVLGDNIFKSSPEQLHSIFELRERTRGDLYLPSN